MAATVFHPSAASIACTTLPNTPAFVSVEPELRKILERACGSSLTYLWGPPGTGKTYVIARLVTALMDGGERVLVASHTHVAVDEMLYAAVRADGPLAGDPRVEGGKVLRIGESKNEKIPDTVRLDKIAERKARELTDRVSALEAEAKPLSDRRAWCRAVIVSWDKLDDLRRRCHEAIQGAQVAQARVRGAEGTLSQAQAWLGRCRGDLEQAKQAWFFRTAKVRQATGIFEKTRRSAANLEAAAMAARKDQCTAEALAVAYQSALATSEPKFSGTTARETAAHEEASLTARLADIEPKIVELQAQLQFLEKRLLQEAQAVFCTLSKNYTSTELRDQRFDAVVVDEISMALPPLIFVAASRASRRVILVGDFKQLPPIVRSDTEVGDVRLRQDAFHLAGVAVKGRAVENCPVLLLLKTQRRMAPDIADVARHLAYGLDGIRDHESVLDRRRPNWLDFLPGGALLTVDTADLHCWSGKQVGSLSRFNFYSGTVALELAARAAQATPKPLDHEPRPIGIVTPFAAQRRLLSRLVLELGLEPWVLAGTVHTFQGNEADLIIFDAVLDEPYWAARLTNPGAEAEEVKRELNVAVTRAKHKFVLLASSEWLNKHARPASALGQLWAFLRDRAPLVSACDVVQPWLAHRLSGTRPEATGWRVPEDSGVALHEILDETTFFQRFSADMKLATESVFGLAPYFGEFRWPHVEPLFRAALERGVEVTLVIPPLAEAPNRSYVNAVVKNLRHHGAVVVTAGGLHGKDVVIDERIHYTGSLNWASHRGRAEVMHRTDSPRFAKLVLEYMQARYMRTAAVHEDGSPRQCPECGGPVQIVNQRQQHGRWDFQSLKVGCASYHRTGCKYLRNVDERPPFREIPLCTVDNATKYRRARRGRGEVWQCPKHPRDCPPHKVVPGDPQ